METKTPANQQVTYQSLNRVFRATQTEEMLQVCALFNIYLIATNLRVAVLNAEDATYRFIDANESIDTEQLQELIEFAHAMKPKYQTS